MTSRNRHSLLAAFVLFCALPLVAANWTEPTAQLAREIAGIAGPGNAALTVRNVSSLSADDAAQIRRGLEAQLHAAGVRIVDANTAASELALTLSENVQGYLWIVEIHQGNEVRIVMQAVPRPAAVAAPTARSGVSIAKALLWSQQEPPDMVILDYRMPKMDGLEFARRFRRPLSQRDVPVMLVTVVGDEPLRQAALDAGIIDFMVKPIRPRELRSRCKNLLDLRQRQQALDAHPFPERLIELGVAHKNRRPLVQHLVANETADPETITLLRAQGKAACFERHQDAALRVDRLSREVQQHRE
jgi:DNA-binding response OmpR family regulator